MEQKITRAYDFDIIGSEEKPGRITGRPIVYDSVTDLGYFFEKIAPGALDEADLRDVRLLINHNTDMVPLARSRRNNINSTMQLIPVTEGMDFRADLDIENNQDAKNLYSALNRGDITGMSFMFTIDGEEWTDLDTEKPTRTIDKIKQVYEISAVTFPAYEDTSIQAQRSADKDALDSARATLESVRREEEKADIEAKRQELINMLDSQKED